jgi:hypothetical protein
LGSKRPPLFVDLDGTLVSTDTTVECILALLNRPLRLGSAFYALRHGRAAMKQATAAAAALEPARLPYNERLLARLRDEAAAGRSLVLATGADQQIAAAVAAHLGLFEAVLASDGKTNLVGGSKLAAIRGMVGGQPFSYAGNERKDLVIWRAAESAILVGAPERLRRAVAATTRIEEIFDAPASRPRRLGGGTYGRPRIRRSDRPRRHR